MRKLFMLTYILAVHFSFAQFEDSKWLLGGDIGSSSSTASLGWILKPDVIIGIQPKFGLSNSENSSDNNTTTHSWGGLNIFYRKHKRLDDKLFLTFQVSGGYSRNKSKNEYGDSTFSKNIRESINLALTPGLAFKTTDWLIFEARLGQARYSIDKTSSNRVNSNDFSRNSNMNNGFSVSLSNLSFGLVIII
ncbi:MAG: hypothetical protein GY816_23030 [Cytophagales bacterium]|nr:hypothetical protein [Cytophagales bacterium]